MRVDHERWMTLATEEYRRLERLISELSPDEWTLPTDCIGWRGREIVAHLNGAAASTASIREQLRQQRIGAREKGDGLLIDAVNNAQVRERTCLEPEELNEEFSTLSRRSLKSRRHTPSWVRALEFKFPPPVGKARIGFLNDVVYTRDAWMHRIDICRATGRSIELTDSHDAYILADAAHAWLAGAPSPGITLTGPAGGAFGNISDQTITVDAVEFARALSGRGVVESVASNIILF